MFSYSKTAMERVINVQDVIFAGDGERSRGWQAAEKMAARRAVEKTRDGKVKKRLSHPAWKSRKPRGIPTFPQPRRLREIN
jgi:hypothetical protein